MEGLASGEEMERALLELGAAVKEETPDATAQAADADAGAGPSAGAGCRCVLCGGELAAQPGTPRLMDCLHSACEPCIRARQETTSDNDFLGAERAVVTCPQCQLACNPQTMIEQRFLMEKMAQAAAQNDGPGEEMCSSCEEPEPATSYCVQCAEYICQRCVAAHQRLKITKDHSIRSKELAGRAPPQPGVLCAQHPTERLALYCETCERLTCRDCQLAQHRDHRHQFAHEMAAAARHQATALLGEVTYKRVLLASAMQVIQERQQLIADKKRALVHDITQAVVRLTNAINCRGKQLVLRLGQVCDAKQRTLSEKKEALERLAAVTEHCVQFVTVALDGSDAALLYSKRVLTSHLQRVKARRADIPNPEIPVRIQLQLDALPELVRVVSSMGAIVVDGKVDGGGGGAQGPYHPPHHAAMQQVQRAHYTAGDGGGGGAQGPYHPPHHAAAMQQCLAGVGGGARGRGMPPTPLRHPHVTSTTHPHHLQGMSERSLRGLLRPPPATHAALQHAAMQLACQQMMGAYVNHGSPGGPPRTPSPAAPPATWHIPQHALPNSGSLEACSSGAGAGGEARGARRAGPPAAVTSSSPEDLDRLCAHSVRDLMATIAKLDSNGVQVVREAGTVSSPGPAVSSPSPAMSSPAPVVHSSSARAPPADGDPNEDWCAVCMDGGQLMCCDKCPKVFHQYCHIPTIDKLPDETETWQCLLCVNLAELDAAEGEGPGEGQGQGEGLSPRHRRLVQRLTLELYCQYEPSRPFREPVALDNRHYYATIARPMCLDTIRAKLSRGGAAAAGGYSSVAQFVDDVRQIFRNAYAYNAVDSQIYKDAQRLEEFFECSLAKWAPEHAQQWGVPNTKRPRLQ